MKKTIFLFIILIGYNIHAAVLETQEIPTSVRAIGMGETFMGIADDVTTIRWNPAGLALVKRNEVNLMFSDLYQSGLYNLYGAFAFPFQRINTIAVDWLFTGFKEEQEFISGGVPELGYGEHLIYASFARKINEKIFAGASLKYYRINVSYDGETWADGQGIGADIGGLWKFLPKFTAGAVVKNIIPLQVSYGSGKTHTLLKPNIGLGVSYTPLNYITIGLDINDSLHLGGEYRFMNMFALRAGAIKGLTYKGEDSIGLNFGAGIQYKFAQIDYAYAYNADLLPVHRISASLGWGFHAYLVDVVSVNIQDLFASMYKSYANENVVRIMVKNKTTNPIDADVGIYIASVMDKPTMQKVSLTPGVPTEVKLPIVFSDDVMKVKDDMTTSADIVVSYQYEDRKSEDYTPAKFVLYNRNAFIWDDLDKIASFVTPQDDKIKEFSREVLQSIMKGKIKANFISDNFYKALIIFNAIGNYGVTYISDPNRPFALTSETKNAIDYIQYPAETLKFKSGDCDDCVVLYASCLENVGISTILIDVPGHIFMMFDSGLTLSQAKKEGLTEDKYVEVNDRVWIPVETTLFQQGFIDAWEEASLNLKQWLTKEKSSEEDLRVCNVEESWKKYPSANIPKEKFSITLADNKLRKMMSEDINKMLSDQDEKFLTMKKEYEENTDSEKANNKMGIYYAKSGLYPMAEQYFNESIRLKGDNVAAYNNLGNLYLVVGEYDKAIEKYEAALKLKPNDPEIAENLRLAKLEKQKNKK